MSIQRMSRSEHRAVGRSVGRSVGRPVKRAYSITHGTILQEWRIPRVPENPRIEEEAAEREFER
jgi:hypothetical protein